MVGATNQSALNVTALSLYHPQLSHLLLVGFTLIFLVIITIVGNVLVIVSLSRFKSLRTVSNLLIGNLAASDFLLATTVLPFSAVYECLGRWIFGKTACNIWLLADVLYCTASIWNICVIALDRFTATLFPLWYRERGSSRQACLYVAAIWFIAAATCTPPLFGWNDLSENYVVHVNFSSVHMCILFQTPSYVVYSACFSFYVPFVLTLLLYVQIVVVLKRRLRFIRRRQDKYREVRPGDECRTKPSTPAGGGPTCATLERPKILCHDADDLLHHHHHHQDGQGDEAGDSSRDDVDRLDQVRIDPLFSDPTVNSNSVEEVSDAHAILLRSSLPPRSDPSSRMTLHVPRPDNEPTSESLSPDHLYRSPLRVSDRRISITSIVSRVRTPHRQEIDADKAERKSCKSSTRRRKIEKREMRATLRMAVVIGAFCMMWVGFFTLYLIAGVCRSCKIPRSMEAFVFWLGYSNSAINPFLYAIFNVEFRKAFKKVLGIRSTRRA